MIPITEKTMFVQGDINQYLNYYLDQLDKDITSKEEILEYYKAQVSMYGLMSLRCLLEMMYKRELYRECSYIKTTFDNYVHLWDFLKIPPLENEVSVEILEDYYNTNTVYITTPEIMRYSQQRILITCVSNILVNRVEMALNSNKNDRRNKQNRRNG